MLEDIKAILASNDISITILGIKLIGSYLAGSNRIDSDIDFSLSYIGNIKEDSLFNIINSEGLAFFGIRVDINSIREW